ncbi:hypothetical protein P3L10_031595 [Capsicum annuum]
MLNSNIFVASCSVSLRCLICGFLAGPPYHTKFKEGLVVSNKYIESDIMDETKSHEIESLKEENLRLRQQMMGMYRAWASGLPLPPFPIFDPHASKSIPRQMHLNTSTTLSISPQYMSTTFTAPHTVCAFVAQPSTKASTLSINPTIVLSQSTSDSTFNTVDDHWYTLEPTVKLSKPPKFLTKKPSMPKEPEKMVGKVKSVENDMKNSPGLMGYKDVSYKNWGMSSSVNLPPNFETSKFGEPDGQKDSVKHSGRHCNQPRETKEKKKENAPIVMIGPKQSLRGPTHLLSRPYNVPKQEYKVPSVLQQEYKEPSLSKNDYYKKSPITKDVYKKVPSVPKQEYKAPSVPKQEDKAPSVPKHEYEVLSLSKSDYYKKPSVSSLPKSDYYKKPSIPEDNYKKVPSVPKVTSMPKHEYEVSSLPKSDYYMKPSIPEDNYKKVPSVPKIPLVPKHDYEVPYLPKNDYYKKPSVLEDNYKKVSSVPKVPSVAKHDYEVPSLPKNDYYKKPSILEDNYKKVPYVPKVPSVPKHEYEVPSLPKNDYYKMSSVPEDNYKKVLSVPKIPSIPKHDTPSLPKNDYYKKPTVPKDSNKKPSYPPPPPYYYNSPPPPSPSPPPPYY